MKHQLFASLGLLLAIAAAANKEVEARPPRDYGQLLPVGQKPQNGSLPPSEGALGSSGGYQQTGGSYPGSGGYGHQQTGGSYPGSNGYDRDYDDSRRSGSLNRSNSGSPSRLTSSDDGYYNPNSGSDLEDYASVSNNSRKQNSKEERKREKEREKERRREERRERKENRKNRD